MIRAKSEVSVKKIQPEVIDKRNHRKEFTSGDAVTTFWFSE